MTMKINIKKSLKIARDRLYNCKVYARRSRKAGQLKAWAFWMNRCKYFHQRINELEDWQQTNQLEGVNK